MRFKVSKFHSLANKIRLLGLFFALSLSARAGTSSPEIYEKMRSWIVHSIAESFNQGSAFDGKQSYYSAGKEENTFAEAIARDFSESPETELKSRVERFNNIKVLVDEALKPLLSTNLFNGDPLNTLSSKQVSRISIYYAATLSSARYNESTVASLIKGIEKNILVGTFPIFGNRPRLEALKQSLNAYIRGVDQEIADHQKLPLEASKSLTQISP